jgi:hypothetical protein
VGAPTPGVGSEVASHRGSICALPRGRCGLACRGQVSPKYEQVLEDPSYRNVNGEERNVALALLQAGAKSDRG